MGFIIDHAVHNTYKKRGYNIICKLITSILVMCHFYVCIWIYLGDKYFLNDYNDPWLISNSGDFGEYNEREIYVFAFYWIMETITTVGYGDYSGGTKAEYIFSMIVEFSGLSLCSILMFAVDKLFQEDFHFAAYIEDKYSQLDIWITKIEKCNKPKFIRPQLF
jgi:hypothetical protein